VDLKRFRTDLACAYNVDPSLADALMFIEMLDCNAKIGAGFPSIP
jgi:hypothetical protein